MIKLSRGKKPEELTPQLEAELVAKFKEDGSSVWSRESIRVGLAASSHNKCAYCECALLEESKYIEVEHFRCKDRWPDEVVSWENLLPACKRCNGTKSSHDVVYEPIVNPYDLNPRDHFYMQWYRLYAITDVGELTLEVLGLNDVDRVVKKRFELGNWIHAAIEQAHDKLQAYEQLSSVRRRNALLGVVRALLEECQRTASYAATSATVLHQSGAFSKLANRMRELDLWGAEFEDLYRGSSDLALQRNKGDVAN